MFRGNRASPLGASAVADGNSVFRVWAPFAKSVDVATETGGALKYWPLERAAEGYFKGTHPLAAGTRYRYRLDGGECLPDPASRFQPDGPHGPSEIVDARQYKWRDAEWPGVKLKGQVIYELHVGACTPEGTYNGVRRILPELKALGVTLLELMPLHTFPGRFNWGYDGVNLFAPYAGYGTPNELRQLVDEAHALGLGVLLDVVYNHFGPDGNYLRRFSTSYFHEKAGEWGDPLNFDGEASAPVREFVLQNARYWIEDFHFDGLRVDATQCVVDRSVPHVLTELTTEARQAAGKRSILVMGEDEPQDLQLVRPAPEGGYGFDALWIEDFHHSTRVASTGAAEAYLQDYRGTGQEMLSLALRNALFQGQWYPWQKQGRGTESHLLQAPQAVFFLQNHDQVANGVFGERIHLLAGAPKARALTTFFLLLPQTPLLFMGQELFADSPWHYFVDHHGDLLKAVHKGRCEFLAQFPSTRAAMAEGANIEVGEVAFQKSKLKPPIGTRTPAWQLHQALLTLRREDPVFSAQRLDRMVGATLTEQSCVLRFMGESDQGDRLVVLNLGVELNPVPMAEPLLAPPRGMEWKALLSSEESRFGGRGGRGIPASGVWSLPGNFALVLTSQKKDGVR
ncbi:MAG: malto-oligosyltrehalose trehalohydrolase [Myxococcaceae bacterium]